MFTGEAKRKEKKGNTKKSTAGGITYLESLSLTPTKTTETSGAKAGLVQLRKKAVLKKKKDFWMKPMDHTFKYFAKIAFSALSISPSLFSFIFLSLSADFINTILQL